MGMYFNEKQKARVSRGRINKMYVYRQMRLSRMFSWPGKKCWWSARKLIDNSHSSLADASKELRLRLINIYVVHNFFLFPTYYTEGTCTLICLSSTSPELWIWNSFILSPLPLHLWWTINSLVGLALKALKFHHAAEIERKSSCQETTSCLSLSESLSLLSQNFVFGKLSVQSTFQVLC